MKFFSQVGQDSFLFENFFYGHRGGVFVDVGAYDGEQFSNTLFFERYMDWHGICVEPIPSAFAKLAATRTAICKQVCIADFEGESEFTEVVTEVDGRMLSGLDRNFHPRHAERLRSVAKSTTSYKVPVTRLSSLLAGSSLSQIDYCSIDTEGSEFNIISDFDFDKFQISLLTIEDNYNDERIPRAMHDKGYDVVAKLAQDYVFKRRQVKRLPRTTVVCAVWHGDPTRRALLRGHLANLQQQSIPIEIVYVFDGGDTAPDWLTKVARTIGTQEKLTIYQAWNVALSLVRTPFVMNLNLDDRLAPGAIELMENTLIRESAWAVGGEWKICYSQAETDKVGDCYPAEMVPFKAEWPPIKGTNTRLGSGTGERGTPGPAVMWRMEAHIGAPRYPWRLVDGSQIKVAGDVAWWTILGTHLSKKVVRLRTIIGNYHSHPGDQAEFRKNSIDEIRLMKEIGIAPV